MRATKEALGGLQTHGDRAEANADDLIAACYASDDFREGVAAFLAKRPPRSPAADVATSCAGSS